MTSRRGLEFGSRDMVGPFVLIGLGGSITSLLPGSKSLREAIRLLLGDPVYRWAHQIQSSKDIPLNSLWFCS